MTDLSADDLRKRLGNVDQIKDLLFGSLLAEYEQRFEHHTQQIEHIDARLTDLKAETSRHLIQLRSELSAEIQQEFASLGRQFHQV